LLTLLMKKYLKHIEILHRSCAKQVQLIGHCVCSPLACRWQVQVYLSCNITHVLSDSVYTAKLAHVSSNGNLHFDYHALQNTDAAGPKTMFQLAFLVVLVESPIFQQSCHGSLSHRKLQCLL